MSREDPTNAPHFNQFLLKQIEDGRAVLLLDGLDEVPALDRHQIVESIQDFLHTIVNPTLDNLTSDPGDVGGNQFVITSRLAGYELAPITDDTFRHFIIRPFDEKSIEDYCRHWAEMVFSRRTPNYGRLADELAAAILRDSSPTIQELAKNPLLLQVLCELAAPVEVLDEAISGDRLNELPRIRAEIYGQAITVMTNRWKLAYDSVAEKNEHVKRLLEPGKMEELLSYVALEMQRREILTRATREQLSGWLELALGKVEGKTVLSMSPGEVTRTTSALLDLVRTHVGVITESAPGVFQFHHLTFQEYLAGKALCRTYNGKTWETAERLGKQIAAGEGGLLDQRWREPLFLAFGYLGATAKIDQTVPQPAIILKTLREAWQEANSDATPEEASLLVASLLLELPDDLIIDLLAQAIRDLVLCYKIWFESGVSKEKTNFFIQALAKLRRRLSVQMESDGINPFDKVAGNIIESIPELSAPLARIFVDRGWLTSSILTAFVKAREHDHEIWGWPLHQGLRRAVLDRDDLEPKVLTELQLPDTSAKIQERNNYERVLDVWREQKKTDTERVIRPALSEPPRIQALLATSLDQIRKHDSAVLRWVIATCGGFYDFQCARWRQEYADLASFLQQDEPIRDRRINEEPEKFIPRWGATDTIYNIAVYLDADQGGRNSLIHLPSMFRVQGISHDPSESMLRILEKSLNFVNRNEITTLLQRLATVGDEPAIAAEAWMALLASGQASSMLENADVAERVRWHCGRVLDELRDAVVRFVQKKIKNREEGSDIEDVWSILNRWLSTSSELEMVSTFQLVMEAITEATGEPEKPRLTWEGEETSPMKLALWGEAWAEALAGRSDDPVYSLAVCLDTLKFSSEPVQAFLQCKAIVNAINMRFVAGVHEGLFAPATFTSNEEALDYFFTILQFLCETAGLYHADFRTALFNKVVSGFFKQQKKQPPLMLMLLAGYLGAPQEFNKLREEFLGVDVHEYPLSDEWKLADLLSNESQPSATTIGSDLALAMHLCRLDDLSTSDGWKAFTIFLAANVARKSNNALESQEVLWLQLKSDVEKDANTLVETLATLLSRAGNVGLTMNETVSRVIEALAAIDSKTSLDALMCVLPLVSHTTPSEIIRLRSWIDKSWQFKISDQAATLLSRHAALFMAEYNVALEPSWIRPILDLAQYGDDRSKARAVLVLSGPFGDVKRGIRKRALSTLGFDTIKNMVDCYFHEYLVTGKKNLINRCFDDVHFDHQEAAIWLKDFKYPKLANVSALPYLFGLGTWNEEALEAFAQLLDDEPSIWNDAFIIGYGSLAYYQYKHIPASLHEVMSRLIESHKVTAHLLPETESYAMVIKAGLQAIVEAAVKPQDRASALLKAECECLLSGVALEGFDLIDICSDLAESMMQWFDTFPEDCWPYIKIHVNDDRLFELIFHWLVKELKEWSIQRSHGIQPLEPCHAYSGSVRNALLSVLCVMSEQKRDEFVLLTANLEQQGIHLSVLLSEAAVYHAKLRSRMAAITLLSRLPNLDAKEVGKVLQAALGDEEQMRNRALILLPLFRDFEVTTTFIDEALAKLISNEPASIVLAYANLLISLLTSNRIEQAKKRREIMNALRNAASTTHNIRLLSHLAGSGSNVSPRKVVNDRRLDQALLAMIAKSYSNFFRNA